MISPNSAARQRKRPGGGSDSSLPSRIMFLHCSHCRAILPRMPDEPLRPADSDDLCQALAFALTHDGRRQFRTSSESMARITAEHLARHLEMSGFVVMRRAGRGGFPGIAREPQKAT